LVYNYEDKGFSTFSLPIHTLGSSKIELELTWLDVTDSWTESDWAWSAKTNQAGYPTSLMGSQYGKVYKLNDGGSDDGSAIEFQAISGRWNPYFLQGYKARLGWIDFLVDVNADVSFDIKNYINTDATHRCNGNSDQNDNLHIRRWLRGKSDTLCICKRYSGFSPDRTDE
jgi:hypothetical protein